MVTQTKEEREKKKKQEEAFRKKQREEGILPQAGAKEEGQAFIRAREKLANKLGGGPGSVREATRQLGQGNQTFAQIPVSQAQAQQATAQEQFFQPAQTLETQLTEDIQLPPDISPEQGIIGAVTEQTAQPGLVQISALGNAVTGLLEKVTGKEFARSTPQELGETTFGKIIGNALGITELALAAVVALPFISQVAATSVIGKAVTTRVAGMNTAVKGLGELAVLGIAGKGVFDFQGGEIKTLRSSIRGVVEDGERIEAAVRNGFPSGDSLELLQTMTNEVNAAEQRIKELGELNIQYRVSKEWIDDMSNIRSAREALLRRVLAVQNIAATGQAALNPEELLFIANQFPK